jgi:outer membrane protein
MSRSAQGPVSPWCCSGCLVRLTLAAVLLMPGGGACRAGEDSAPASATAPRQAARPLTLAECIAVALQNQPGIRAQEAGVGIANNVKDIARSYYFPQVSATGALVQMSSNIFIQTPDPLTGPLGGVISDAAAFFGIARAAGSAAALQALNQPNLPPFSTAKQIALNAIPDTIPTNILGNRFLTATVQVTQPLYTGGKITYRNQQADLGIQAATVDVNQARLQTTYEVSRAYFGILLARALLKITDDTIGQFRAVEHLAQSSIEERVRSVTLADLQRPRALRELTESQRVQFQRATDLAYAGLQAAMGIGPRAPVEIADEKLEYQPIHLEVDPLIELALTQRPETIKARLAMRNAELERKLATAEFCPDVGLFGTFFTIQDDPHYLNPTVPTIVAGGLQARLPLFEGGRRLAQQHKAEAMYAQAREYLQFQEQNITLEVRQAYLEYQEMTERIPIDVKTVADARATLKSYDALYAARAIEPADLPKHFENLSTTRLLISGAELGYYQHIYAYNLALAKLRLTTASHDLQATPTRVEPSADGDLPAPRRER